MKEYKLDVIDQLKLAKGKKLLKTSYLNDELVDVIIESSDLELIFNKRVCIENYNHFKRIIGNKLPIKIDDFEDLIEIITIQGQIKIDLSKFVVTKSSRNIYLNDKKLDYINNDQIKKIFELGIATECNKIYSDIRKKIKVCDLKLEKIQIYNREVSIEDIVTRYKGHMQQCPKKYTYAIFDFNKKDKQYRSTSKIEEEEFKRMKKIYEDLKEKCIEINNYRDEINKELTVRLLNNHRIIDIKNFKLYEDNINKYIYDKRKCMNYEEVEELLVYSREKLYKVLKERIEKEKINFDECKKEIKEKIDKKMPKSEQFIDSITYSIDKTLDLSNEIILNELNIDIIEKLYCENEENKFETKILIEKLYELNKELISIHGK